MSASEFAARLLEWYAGNARDLPWRRTHDPYAIWVSEIMLQQTRVEAVIPYYRNWMQRFPSLAALAQAPLQDVLAAWEGLGYYSRARSLHRAAQEVIQHYAGSLPHDAATLEKLPGVGAYTAAAIASIAFGQDAPAVDANIRRVLARVFDVQADPAAPSGQRQLQALCAAHLPPGRAGDYHQAMMDLANALCTASRPRCLACPLNSLCLAYQAGVQEQRPVRHPKPPTPHYVVAAAVICQDGQYLIAQRPAKGLLGSLWEFPGGKQQPGEDLPACLQREIDEELAAQIDVHTPLGIYQHAYTHFRVTLHAFACTLRSGSQPRPVQAADLRWVQPEGLAHYPMGKIDRQIARRIATEPPC